MEGDPLSPQELRVLKLYSHGLTASQTGKQMHLSGETVRSYRKRIIAKLGARNGTHAVATALRRKLIT